MQRTLYNELVKWKNSPQRKPMILEGARQVGKTYLAKELGQNEYANMAYVNFYNNPAVAQLFRDFDMSRILLELSAYSGETITPGQTLIFLDEVQEVDNGIASLKYFCENIPEYHVIAAGSLLGVMNKEGESYPVGKVNTLRLFPMTFEEFLLALGKTELLKCLEQPSSWVSPTIHESMITLLRHYYFVGGMPEVVNAFVQRNDANEVRSLQKEILMAYDRDFAKHAKSETQKIRMVWNSIPAQLAKENKKFIFGAVRKGGRAATFDNALEWLREAALVHKVKRNHNPTLPLSFYADMDSFKLFIHDVGLLGALSNANPFQMLSSDNVFVEFKGAFTENFILQQMLANGIENAYYYSKDNSTMEIDFLIDGIDRAIPIEAKAEENVQSKSLRTFVTEEYPEKKFHAIRFSMRPYINQGWMENIPLWAVGAWTRSLQIHKSQPVVT
ncbi:MAG: ATP-binding protein [Bacteroidales bacterium]|nr:ATP-binding protein [Bacteroidales bacterium]